MPNYQNGKIYKITAGELTYIGSTCEPTLARRLALHVSNYKRWLKGAGNCSCFKLIETGQYDITLIELYPCGSKDELTARERYYIESNVCVNERMKLTSEQLKERHTNKFNAEYMKKYRTEHDAELKNNRKKYDAENADKIKEYTKKYKAENADKFKEYSKKYYEEHSAEQIERAKKYNAENADKIKEYKRKYYQEHKKS